jgi:hypothetical protein
MMAPPQSTEIAATRMDRRLRPATCRHFRAQPSAARARNSNQWRRSRRPAIHANAGASTMASATDKGINHSPRLKANLRAKVVYVSWHQPQCPHGSKERCSDASYPYGRRRAGFARDALGPRHELGHFRRSQPFGRPENSRPLSPRELARLPRARLRAFYSYAYLAPGKHAVERAALSIFHKSHFRPYNVAFRALGARICAQRLNADRVGAGRVRSASTGTWSGPRG